MGILGRPIIICDDNITAIARKKFKPDCKNNCLKECDSYKFHYSISNDPSPNTRLKVFFSELSYKEIRQVPKVNFVLLTSSIGGTLGCLLV